MVRKCYLTFIEKVKIDILKKSFISNVNIAKEIGRSKHIVRDYLKLGQKYGLKPKTKGNQKLSPRAICKILLRLQNQKVKCSNQP